MMKYENFNEFFSNLNENNKEIISNWEKIRNKKKKANIITLVIALIIDIIIVYMYNNGNFPLFTIYQSQFLLLFVLVIIFIIDTFILVISEIIFGSKDIRKFNEDYKEKVINKLLENFIEELDYVPLKELPSKIYDEAQYGGSYNHYNSDDWFEGKINGQKIVMADLLVEEETEKEVKDANGNETTETETETVFNGLFGKIDLNKSILSNMCITMDDSFSFSKKQKIEMDSYEFEKVFDVYGDNEIIAMQLLTADVQEDILELYNKYKIDFNISIMQNKMYILFDTDSMFEVFSMKKNPNEILEKYFDIMKFIYKLVDKITKTIDSTQI